MADQNFSVNCGFFDAINYDRTYTADDMNKPYSRVVGDGVFATQTGTPSTDLQVVSAGSGMNITVMPGQGIFASKWFENPSSIVITVPNNTTLYPRRDSVIVQVDNRSSGRVGNIVYRTGTPASSPQPPDIGTVANVTEYRIANIYVAANANTINNDAIVDLRGSSECPWVTGLITQVDTSVLWTQWQNAYQNYYDTATTDFEEYCEEQRESWEAFLQTLTSELEVIANVVMFTSSYTAVASVTNIPIDIASYNPDTDILQVYINGLLALENSKYTINASGTSIDLVNAISAGNTVNFVVFKSIVTGDLESAVAMIQKLDSKVSNFMADSGWINFTLESGATAYNSSYVPAVRCIGNRVYLRGAFKGLTTLGKTICTLPVSFRPAMDHVYTVVALSGTTIQDTVTINVFTNGQIKLAASSGTLSATAMIPLATSFLAASGTTVSMIYEYMGSVATYADLPTSGMNAGDVYMVQTADATHNIAAGDDVMWNGSEWELLDTVISSGEIDSVIASIS